MNIPTLIYPGTTIEWEDSLDDYSSSEYSLVYYIVSPDNAIKITSAIADDSVSFLFEITATTSATWVTGSYSWRCFAEKGSGETLERYFIESGQLEIATDITIAETYDGRSHSQKVLDAIEAVIEGRASRAESEYEIAGRRIVFLAPGELLKWYNFYKAKVDAETDGGKRQRILCRLGKV